MGHQLWTSPQTGYRRQGTRFSEVRSLFEDGITARAVLEPLQSCMLDAPARDVAQELKDRDFDVAGAQADEQGPVTGYVVCKELEEGSVRDHVHPFGPLDIVSDSLPLAGIFRVLQKRSHVFVVAGSSVSGIVTLADLNKPAARIYLFGVISLLEMHLTFWISEHYEDDAWKRAISDGRLRRAEELLERRRDSGQDLSLLDCLQFCDKRDLVLGSDQAVETLDLVVKKRVEGRLKEAEKMRNNLAHSQYKIAGGASWDDVADLVTWIEEFLERSDAAVEARAASGAEGFGGRLRGATSG